MSGNDIAGLVAIIVLCVLFIALPLAMLRSAARDDARRHEEWKARQLKRKGKWRDS